MPMTDRPFPQRLTAAALLITGCLCFSVSFAQTPGEEVPGETDATDEPVSESREVDVNEDNYRRFMELPDDRIERRSLPPIDSFKPASLEKMENLPEASQKHLRNQLREVIVQQEAWTPDAAGELYPYVPSTAARSNRELHNQEAEAWRELVVNYHEREAAIYANTDRSQAASMSGSPGTAGSAGTGNAKSSGVGGGSEQDNNQSAQAAQSG